MKEKLLTTALLILCAGFFASAQVDKGNLFFGGTTSLDFNSGKEKVKSGSTTSDGAKFTEINFESKTGYFVIDKLPVGIFLDIDFDKQKYKDPDSEYSWSDFLVGPFVRYYITDLDGFMPYGEASLGIGSGKYKSKYMSSSNEEKYGIFAFKMGVGGTYFVTENVGVDLFLGYTNYQEKYQAEEGEYARAEGDDTIYKYGGLNFNIGFVITLGK